jgi:hypothetical protein
MLKPATIADVALDYGQRGWKPVPVDRKTKKARGKDWQKRPFDRRQFDGNGQNVGIQFGAVSGGLCDVDLDSTLAIGLAPEFLPPTDAIFGRRSKPCSHQLYVSDLHTSEAGAVLQFAEYVGGRPGPMIVELRIGAKGKGAISVFPPSMHVTGEMVQWVRDGEPAHVAGNELKRTVLKLAVACLLKQHYPGQGSRHAGALVIGGVLAGAGWQPDDIRHVVEVAARAAGDDDVRDRAESAANAVDLKASGGNVSGRARLGEAWGQDVADTLGKWLNLRGAFDVVPMNLWRAPDVGTGKSFLSDLISTIARGQPCPVITNVKSVEEMEKRLGALVLEGVPIISLDNCSGDIGGDLLCQITERRLIRVRILGKSEAPECEWRGVMFATGNNITLLGDMTRRGLIANLDAKVERPELREFSFDPIERVLADRGSYIAAAITIARAYIAAGSPKVCGALGSYGEWSDFVRSPLVWLGQDDPVKSMDEAREDDPIRRAEHSLIAIWRTRLGLNVGYTAAGLIKKANEQTSREIDSHVYESDWTYPQLRELLVQQAGTPRGDIDARRVGNWLMSIRGRVHNGHCIERTKESASHGNTYALLKL